MSNNKLNQAAKGVQPLERRTITQDNLIESVQELYDRFSGNKVGLDGETFWLADLQFQSVQPEPEEPEE